MSGEYGTLATEVYEFEKPVGRPYADVEYYTGLLADVSGPILEPATGTGRILIPLLEAGHQVEGLDRSPQMLARCCQHCRDRGLAPVLHEADMTAFVQLVAYEAVIIPAGSIALLDGRKATLQALTCFRDSLVPGGRLVVDVLPAACRSTRVGRLAAQAPSGRANVLLEGPPGDRDAELQHQPDAPGVGQQLRLR
jgi:SAM-dependent methyltransferase